jgi:uncharacterized repeat protein (TIGR02543 family)
MSPLQPNTEYAFQVAATNTYGDSAKTPNYTAWTLAAVPAAPTVNNPTAASLDVAIGAGDGNPAGTQYAIRISPAVGGNSWVQANGLLGASAVWQTAAGWGTKTVTGLAENTNYTFTAKARNGVNQETAMGSGGSGQTTYAPRILTYYAGPNGSITGDTPQTVDYGMNGSAVVAVPTLGYHFVNWSDGSTANPRTDSNVTGDISVTANFAINQYTLTYNAGPNGSISGTTPQTVEHGANGSAVMAVPDTGYHFVSWSDGSTANLRIDWGVTGDLTVTANFAINSVDTYTLSYTAGPNGSITGDTPQTVTRGADGSPVTAVADLGYHFVNWSDGSVENPRTDVNVTADHSVMATFAINSLTLTYDAGANGSITGDTPQTVSYGGSGSAVTAVPATGYHFAGWSDGSMENPRTDSNVTGDITVTANFAINQYMLTYNAGASGSISGETPQTVNHDGAGSTVVAVPETGYHFVQWSDGVLTAARTDTNVTGDLTVTATFAINTYTLTYTAEANGSITGPSPQTVDHGSDGAEVTAVPAAGYHFVQWSDASTANPRTDTNVTANITVTATFAINTYTLTYTAEANGSITGTSPQTIDYGTNGAEVTAVSDTGYHFVLWSDGKADNPRTDSNVTTDITVTASFAINQYTLTYAAGANGSITGDTPQTVDYGTSGSVVVAVPALGYHFVNWSDGSTANPRTDSNVTGDISVTANFAINQYTLTYNAGPNGSISGTTPQTVEHGANGSAVMAVPDTGYHFVSWSDGSTANLRIDWGVTGDLTVTANFAINSVDTYTLSYTAGPNGSITGDTPQTVTRGADGSPVTAVADLGYHFVNWSDGSVENPRTDVNVTADHSVMATFAINSLTLTYDAGANGSITGDTPQTVSYGGSGSAVTAVPATGYHFAGWSDGSMENPRTDSNVTGDITVTANFAINQYMLTYNAGASGSISGETPQTVNHDGAGSTVVAVPETGYHFVQWSDGVLTAARTDTNVTGDLTVTATFAINTYTVSFQTDGKPGATLDGATSQTVAHGDDCSPVTANAPEGYRFVRWTKGGADYSTDNPLTVRNVTEDMTLTADFTPSEPAAVKDWPLYE